ncbi:hypothetical protein QFZ94_004868 [Paraburkholderia sp. JPY465]
MRGLASKFFTNRFSIIYPIQVITLMLSVALMSVNSHWLLQMGNPFNPVVQHSVVVTN